MTLPVGVGEKNAREEENVRGRNNGLHIDLKSSTDKGLANRAAPEVGKVWFGPAK